MEKLDIKQVQSMQLDALDQIHMICSKHNLKYYLIAGSLIGAIRHKGFIPWDDDIDIAMMRSDYDRFLEFCKEELDNLYFLQAYGTDKDYYLPIARICMRGTYIYEYYSEHLKFNKGLYLDIHPLDNIPDDEILQAKQEKKLKFIDMLIFYKQCLIYRNGPFKIKRIVKKLLKMILLPVPYKFLMSFRFKIMREYSNQTTQNVCATGSKYGYKKGSKPREVFGEPVLLEFEGKYYYGPNDYDAYLKSIYGNYLKLPKVEEREPIHEVYKI